MRSSGILLPIASLPGKYGIGSFSKEAYDFIDKLKAAGQSCWQILPLGPTGYGDSPYQSFSTFAGNPYFIDLTTLINEGLLKEEECRKYDWGRNSSFIDYEKIYNSRFKVLRLAFERFNELDDKKIKKKFHDFVKENAFWLEDYALFCAIKDSFGGVSFGQWDEDIKMREPKAMALYSKKYKKDAEFVKFLQFKFYSQWMALKQYANDNGVRIIGDIPIYVALDSSDVWASKELFMMDDNYTPIAVAGCPPDAFTALGQLWGNPLYDWDYHKKTGYEWWIKRISNCMKLYDVVRVDHFRGFDAFYTIPYGHKDARRGTWKKGPGYDLFKTVEKQLGKINVIAEDLGFLTLSVKRLVKRTGFPGMKVLQFAFSANEDSDYLPHNYKADCVVYTGTHDNDTLLDYIKTMKAADKKFMTEYMNATGHSDEELAYDMIKLALSSVANMCIIPMQDYLLKDKSARINTPSTLGGNWCWRMKNNEFTNKLAKEIKNLSSLYFRN